MDILYNIILNIILTYNTNCVIVQIKVKDRTKLMEYLKTVLGIHTEYLKSEIPDLPNYIHERYRLENVLLDGRKAVFVYPKTELDTVNALKKHLGRIEKETGARAVLVPQKLSWRQRNYLLEEHIPFIVDGRQIYLPFMAMYLQERCDADNSVFSDILPSTQLLLLYYIYRGCGILPTGEAAKKLSLSLMSVSRSMRQLEEFGLIQSERNGVQKIICSNRNPQELFDAARKYLLNPVKRTIYVSKTDLDENLLLSGSPALAGYSMLSPSEPEYYAASSIADIEKKATRRLQNYQKQCAVELWRYSPEKLAVFDKASNNKRVDRLSLALALRDDNDDRIQEAVDEMLDSVWRDIGCRQD